MTLAIISIFKNEGMIMKEWIEHHIKMGVDKFYMIDNGSTDNSVEILETFRDKTEIHLHQRGFEDTNTNEDSVNHVLKKPITLTNGKRPNVENIYWEKVRKDIETDWLMLMDLDEFLYPNPRKNLSIKDIIKIAESKNITQILTVSKTFIGGGESQPKSVLNGFTKRHSGKDDNIDYQFKALVNFKYYNEPYTMHPHYFTFVRIDENGNEYLEYPYDSALNIIEHDVRRAGDENKKRFHFTVEEFNNDHLLMINHYPVQSAEWFFNVKAKRGRLSTHITNEIKKGVVSTPDEWWQNYWNDNVVNYTESVEDLDILDFYK